MRLERGTRLSRYTIVECIGVGGMGEVYRAHDTVLDKTVAIKTVATAFAHHADAQPRFDLERRIGADLEHPHICRLLDAGRENGIDYLAMEYLTGETVAMRLSRGAVPAYEGLGYAIEIAEALAFAHDHGVIHRDLKPSNVFITPTGIKVLDFGLATLRPRDPRPGTAHHETQPLAPPLTGGLLGTARYMAPERLEGRDADHRTDVFAFGLLLYELLTGRHAFDAPDGGALISAILAADPAPMHLSADRDGELEWLVRKCLARAPAQRWQSMHDVATVLKRLAGIGLPPPAAAKASPRALIASGVVVVALIGLALAAYVKPTERALPAVAPLAFIIEPPPDATFTPTEGSVQTPQLAVSPDGSVLAFIATGIDGISRIWLRPLDAIAAHPLRGTEGATYPFWSYDGQALGFFADGTLKRVEIAGGPSRTLADAPHGRGGAWSQEGIILFAPTTTGVIQRVAASGGAVTPQTQLAASRGDTSHRWPQFLPDGRHFLFFARSPEESYEGVYLASLDDENVTLVANSKFGGVYASPGHVLYIEDGTLLSKALDVKARHASEDPTPVVEGLTGSSNFYGAFSVSASGVLAYAPTASESELAWIDRSGRKLSSVGHGQFVDFRLSADNRSLAVAQVDRSSGLSDVYLLDLQRGTRTRVTADRATDASPVWSPDGAAVMFRSNRERVHDLYVRSTTESSNERAVFRTAVGKYPTSWSHDRLRVLFHTRDQRTQYDVWVAHLGEPTDAKPLLATRFNEVQAQFSPDDRLVAYASDETATFETYVQSLHDGRRWQVSVGGGLDPRWSWDASELFYVAQDGWLMSVRIAAPGAQSGVPRRLFKVPQAVITGPYTSIYDVSADASRFLVRLPIEDVRSHPLTVLVNWQPGPSGRPLAVSQRRR